MDEPVQKHTTSVVKNTVNPFWDEHFLFDLEETSRQITFEVYNREKPPGEDFLGRGTISMADLRRMPSSRQILPLQSNKPGATSSGSLTVEFLFMEPAEAQQMNLSTPRSEVGDSVSPRRRIDTNRTTLPSGTIVTKTTTTTERMKNLQLDTSYNDSPNRIEKTDSSQYHSDYSPYSSRSSHTDAASQARGRLESPQLTFTSANAPHNQLHRGETLPTYMNAPTIQTTDTTTPTDDILRDTRSISTTSGDSGDRRELKKSRSFASAIKKRFSRGPKKPRSHSADRASSLREQHLLKPPEQAQNTNRTTDDLDHTDIPEGAIRKSRSHSFSSSFKKLFGKKKGKGYPSSRESSISRASGQRYGDTSRDVSIAQGSPQISYRDQGVHGQPLSLSPDMSQDYGPYSQSVPPNPSPLYDH